MILVGDLRQMHKNGFCRKIIFLVTFLIPNFAISVENDLNNKITEMLRSNWPYEAFLAIPRISEISSTLAIEISKDEGSFQSLNCIELYYLELKKKYDPDALLERESLHELLCKAMKRALDKTQRYSLIELFPNSRNIALKFNFFTGLVNVVEMPYPPLDPLTKLENVFIDDGIGLNFGGIDFPKPLELEITETPL